MKVVFDVGNTRIKAGVFDRGQLVDSTSWSGAETIDWDGWLNAFHPTAAALVHSGNPPEALVQSLTSLPNFLWVTHETPLPIENTYETPETLGKDRLAGVVGAWKYYPGKASLIVDAGTCITLDFITADGVYLGGNISPGLNMRLIAMHDYTAALPLSTTEEIDGNLGLSTRKALANGGVMGAVYEIEGLYQRLTSIGHSLELIITGGDAHLLSKHTNLPMRHDPLLILRGIYEIMEYNL